MYGLHFVYQFHFFLSSFIHCHKKRTHACKNKVHERVPNCSYWLRLIYDSQLFLKYSYKIQHVQCAECAIRNRLPAFEQTCNFVNRNKSFIPIPINQTRKKNRFVKSSELISLTNWVIFFNSCKMFVEWQLSRTLHTRNFI